MSRRSVSGIVANDGEGVTAPVSPICLGVGQSDRVTTPGLCKDAVEPTFFVDERKEVLSCMIASPMLELAGRDSRRIKECIFNTRTCATTSKPDCETGTGIACLVDLVGFGVDKGRIGGPFCLLPMQRGVALESVPGVAKTESGGLTRKDT